MRVHDANCDVLHQCDECQRMMQIAHSPIPLEALAQIAQLQARVAALMAALEQVRTCDCDLCGACQAALDAAREA